MFKITFSDSEIEALPWRFHHPDPRIQVRMEVLSLCAVSRSPRATSHGCVAFPQRASIGISRPTSPAGSSS
jgi:hypothetical protein